MQNVLLHSILSERYNDFTYTALSGGASDANVYQISLPTETLLLKQIPSDSAHELQQEIAILNWLSPNLLAPKYCWHTSTETNHWLCMSFLEGQTLDSIDASWTITERITAYASTLQRLHSIPVDVQAPVRPLNSVLMETEKKVIAGQVDTTDFEAIYQGKTAESLLEDLQTLIPTNTELVFTHGDYCPGNLLFQNKVLSGLIDWGRGGVADRYQDLALAIRSIRHEWGEAYVQTFLEIYGLTEVDQQKLEFYTLLDEFF